MAVIQLPNEWVPRKHQMQLWTYLEGGGKRAAAVWHRRAGKDSVALNWTATAAHQRVGTYWHMLPTQTQGRKTIWDGIDRHGRRMIDQAFPPPVRTNYRKDEMKIELKCGSIWQVVGSDNYNNLIGSNPVGVVFSEYSVADPAAWDYIRPILAENGGWAVFIFTARGRNHGALLYEMARDNPSWFAQILTVDDTGVIGPEVIQEERDSGMSDDMIDQEYYCFPGDALVMCSDQARPIGEIKKGDIVLSHTGRFRSVEDVIVHDHVGEMVVIDAWGSRPITCTPNHPMQVCDRTTQTYSWKAAGTLTADDWLVTPRMSEVKPVISAALATIIAWYACEGSASKNAVQFTLGANEPDNVAILCAALDAEGYSAHQKTDGSVTQIVIYDVGLADFLIVNCGSGSHNKRLPLGLLRGHEALVWRDVVQADGCVHTPTDRRVVPVHTFTSVSETLVQQVQLLGASQGYAVTYSVRDAGTGSIEGREFATRESYLLQMRRGTYNDTRTLRTCNAKNGVLGRVKSVVRQPYQGPVYNLRVAIDESYVVNSRAVHNCSFQAAISGSYYGKQMVAAEKDGRICEVPYEPNIRVETWWDLGVGDSTAIWFVQRSGREIRVIDYYEMSGEGLPHYAKVLQTKDYVYSRHIAPHDIEVRELGTGKSRRETAAALGIKFQVAPNLAIDDGIDAMRAMLARCWFDKRKTGRLIEALKQYRKDWNDKLKVFQDHPCHDWTSHAADAGRMGAVTGDPRDERNAPRIPAFRNVNSGMGVLG